MKLTPAGFFIRCFSPPNQKYLNLREDNPSEVIRLISFHPFMIATFEAQQ